MEVVVEDDVLPPGKLVGISPVPVTSINEVGVAAVAH